MHKTFLSSIGFSQNCVKEKKPMKRVVCFALALLLLGGGRAWAETPESGLSVSAPSAILMEKETGTVLFAKNAEEPGTPRSRAFPPASPRS